jgi:hypothetical protein|tara:strand:- start:4563 stop:6515 length:1953 start_codon:yes stop_codon:yes gene_type:complete
MAQNNSRNLFQRLTRLFRSGPVVKRSVLKDNDKGYTASAFESFRKNQSQVYSNAMSAYGTYDRMARYSDFSEMEYTPEIASALDIYSEESVSADESGKTLHIYSDNSKIQQLLKELFYDTLNVEFNMSSWVRNLVKYGDCFLFNDVHPKHGVINAYPLPISEIEREEGFDPNDPMAVRFRWVTQGNQVLENWQVSHMRLLGNDAFLPYGSSVLEPARRIWRQMILLEDAMLVHRIVRAPDRRVFYIDVGNVPPEEVANYMEQAQSSLKRSSIVDKSNGRVDLRYNPLSIDEDYFIPVRGGDSGTKIDSVTGQTIAGETNDVEYIQKKLFAALKIPKAYLGYDEGLGAKATLSQEDIRFSRTIARIQRTILSEMNKIAIVHLYCNGYSSEDLLDFKLMLSNPSTIAQQQKLELYNTKFTTAGTALQTAGLVDRTWVQKNILRLTDDEIKSIQKGMKQDKVTDLEIEATQLSAPDGPENPAAGLPQFDGGNVELGAGGGIDLGALSEQQSINDEEYPIKVQKLIELSLDELDEKSKIKKDRRGENKNSFATGTNNSMKVRKRDDPANAGMDELEYELNSVIKPEKPPNAKDLLEEDAFNIDDFLNKQISVNAKMNDRIKSTLQRFDNTYGKQVNTNIIISENNSSGEDDNET